MTAALPWSRRIGYAVGDFGFNLFFTTASLYLLYYYTDVLGLPPATAGWVFAVALIADALFDPYMGFIASRTRTRWGRYRPYLLFGCVPLAASWALMFLPVTLEGAALVLFAMSTHILFRILYAVVGMPYLALSATMTRDSQERGVIASVRMIAATTCGLFVAFSTLKLVEAFGGGRHGFFATACLYGALATIVLLVVFATAREPEDDGDAHAATLAQMWQAVRANRPFWIVSAAMLASIFGSTLFGKTLPYHFKYALERPDLIGLALTVMTGAVALSMPVWTLVMRRTSKRVTWMAGVAVGLTGYATFVVAGSAIGGLLAALALIGAGAGAAYLGFWSMMPDTVEYGEWKTGIRSEGGVFGIVSLIQKAGFGIAAALLGEALGAIGYRAGATQTAATLESMRWLMLGGGSTMALIGAALISMYPIDRNRHARLLDAIAARAKAEMA